jgi:capsular exopolysaccharide synthesis family protein
MSTFFKALERAEQERGLRHPAPAAEPTSTEVPTPAVAQAPEMDSARALQSVFKPPRPADVRPEPSTVIDERAAGVEEHLVSLLAPNSFEAEQYRALRHMIEQLHRSSNFSIIAVSSADAGDGKTTTTINLAGALAQAHDTRVLLVDGDLRGANLAADLGLDDHAPGLVEAITDPSLPLAVFAQAVPHLNLSVIAAGRHASAPYEVLKSPRVGTLFDEARKHYDYVIVDTPPLVSVPDSRVIAKWVDGFLIVVAAHRTPRRLVEEALNLLDPSQVVGMVFNGDDHHVSMGSYSVRRQNIVRSRPGR